MGEAPQPLGEGNLGCLGAPSEAHDAVDELLAPQVVLGPDVHVTNAIRDAVENPPARQGHPGEDRDQDGLGGHEGDDEPVHQPRIAHRAAGPRGTLWKPSVNIPCAAAPPKPSPGGDRLVRLRIIPREERFFDMFSEDAANVLGAARLLEAMLRSYDVVERRAGEIRDAEHRGDEISHTIGHRLESTFVTPFDREEIHALISGLDDVLDFIEEVADTFVLYRVEAPTAVAVEQAAIIVKQCEQLHEALTHLRGFKHLEKYWIEVHRLENEGDQLARKAIADLFADGSDPLEVIKWKES